MTLNCRDVNEVPNKYKYTYLCLLKGNNMTYLEFISHVTTNQISNKHDDELNNYSLSPLGICEPYTCQDINKQVDRLIGLYRGFDKMKPPFNSNLVLYELLNHYYFNHDRIMRDFCATEKTMNYYKATKAFYTKIPNITNNVNQNQAYKTVIRNLLILASNFYDCAKQVDLESIDINLNAVGYLCKNQIQDLLDIDRSVSLKEADRIARYLKTVGGFPVQRKEYVEDPIKKKQLKYIITGVPMVVNSIEIHLYDCDHAHLFYAIFLTALEEKVEAYN